MRVSGHGISIEIPSHWSGRVFTYAGDPDDDGRPTLHTASFAMPTDSTTYGAEVINAMGSSHVFLALTEFTPDAYLPTADISYLEQIYASIMANPSAPLPPPEMDVLLLRPRTGLFTAMGRRCRSTRRSSTRLRCTDPPP